MTLPISTIENDKNLRKPAKALTVEDLALKKTQQLIDDMIPTMFESNGVGIAAPQVGKSLRVIVIGLEKDQPMVVVNPEITFFSKKTQVLNEGCLSVPNISGPVRRAEKVRIKALDRQGKKIKMKATGMLARVFQHEIDHLNGVLFIDRVEDKKQLIKSTSDSAF
jgi:peptide deformylase